MRKKLYWFSPKTITGWKKENKAITRRRKLLDATDKRKTLHDRYVAAARMIQSLANVNKPNYKEKDPWEGKDRETHLKAKADAVYFFKKVKKTPKNK